MIESTSSSICDAVFSPQINPAPPSKYWFCTVARHIMPNLSDIPYIVTMARAIFVAFSISFAAPLVTELNTSTSAARPAIYVVILARSSSFVSRYFSSRCLECISECSHGTWYDCDFLYRLCIFLQG